MNYSDMRWRLAACRVNAGYTQAEIANILGVSEAAVVRWETGQAAPKMENAQKLSALYTSAISLYGFYQRG